MDNKPLISIIAAIAENRALGKDNKLLWHIPEDLKRFKEITRGHPVIMGRMTYESLGKPLPQRTNIIITRDRNYIKEGCSTTNSLEEAIETAKEKEKGEIFIIGGGQIYAQGIKYSDKLYLTIVEGNFTADTFFPQYPEFKKIIFEKQGSFGNLKYKFLEILK